MTTLTHPPYLSGAVGRYLIGMQVTVFRWMPFRGELRIDRSEVIVSGKQLMSATVWTGASRRSRRYHRLPLVAALTQPPYLLTTFGHDLIGTQGTIFTRMPFRG